MVLVCKPRTAFEVYGQGEDGFRRQADGTVVVAGTDIVIGRVAEVWRVAVDLLSGGRGCGGVGVDGWEWDVTEPPEGEGVGVGS